MEYTSNEETAVCNLASLCLPKFIKGEKESYFDFKMLLETTKIATRTLNKVIDVNFYPSEKAKVSNCRNRPIGLGVQGLADVFCILDLPYDSDEARILNKKIFETIYFGSLTMSNEISKKDGYYSTFKKNGGSPFSKGILQYHNWPQSLFFQNHQA